MSEDVSHVFNWSEYSPCKIHLFVEDKHIVKNFCQINNFNCFLMFDKKIEFPKSKYVLWIVSPEIILKTKLPLSSKNPNKTNYKTQTTYYYSGKYSKVFMSKNLWEQILEAESDLHECSRNLSRYQQKCEKIWHDAILFTLPLLLQRLNLTYSSITLPLPFPPSCDHDYS